MKLFNTLLMVACAMLAACNSTSQQVSENKATEATTEEIEKIAKRKQVKLKCRQQARLGSNIKRLNCRDVSDAAKERERRATEDFINEVATGVEIEYGNQR